MSISAEDAKTLAGWDAVETRDQIRKKNVSPLEVVEAAILRAEDARGYGAIVATTYDRARSRAREKKGGAFAGVPSFVKDLAQLRGVETGWGSRGSSGFVSKRTDPFVRRYEELGFVTLGKSSCPELGLTATTEPLGADPCRNPWDRTRSAGGSSGGAACLVALGVVPIAHGSDGGGSIRIPASCCGLVGLKPSRFRMDMAGSNLLAVNVATDGVLTRTVRDTIAFFEASEAAHPPKHVRPIGDVKGPPKKPLRIGFFTEAPLKTPVDPAVREATEAAARTCEELGHHVEPIACPIDGSVSLDFLKYWGLIAWLQVRTARFMIHAGFDTTKVDPWTLGLTDAFVAHRGDALGATWRLRRFATTFEHVMKKYDVLLSPTLAEPPIEIGQLAPDRPFHESNERLTAYCPFTPPYNAAGAPAISLPLGETAEGLPIGVNSSPRTARIACSSSSRSPSRTRARSSDASRSDARRGTLRRDLRDLRSRRLADGSQLLAGGTFAHHHDLPQK